MSEESGVLNPRLADTVAARLGLIRIINRGESLEGLYEDRVDKSGAMRRRLRILRRGETYITNCPFCSDTRGRFSINHRYGVFDDVLGYADYNQFKCFNEECQHDEFTRNKLMRLLTDVMSKLPEMHKSLTVARTPSGLQPCEFPGTLVPVNALPWDHPIVVYLRDQRKPGFDVDELYNLWRISFAAYVPTRNKHSMVQGRIIIPVFLNRVMVGWQARYPDDVEWRKVGFPKYMHFFPKSQTLYGIDFIDDETPFVVLVEGATDVWRYGPGAVGGFGKGLSETQAEMLVEKIKDRPLVVIPDQNDPQSQPKYLEGVSSLCRLGYKGRVSFVPLPEGSDPGSMEREVLRAVVEASLQYGVSSSD